MKILNNFSLKNYNTFGINAIADYFVSISNPDELIELFSSDIYLNNKHFILGDGSNVLFAEDYQGLIINIDIKGKEVVEKSKEYVIVEVGAGEIWNDFVKYCVKNKFYGVENLALIPGKTGAAPVQNIGAYGVEQKDTFYLLKGFEISKKEYIELKKGDCNFGYRDSIFKNKLHNNFVITSVQYKLSLNKNLNTTYKELKNELALTEKKDYDIDDIYNCVVSLRERKLPNPLAIGNGGSFFKNPVMDKKLFDELCEEFPALQAYPVDENKMKVSAGWLIEQCGWKGKRLGNAGVYEKHALVLVNNGNATGKEILSLAKEINDSVKNKFGIFLENEVIVLGNK